MGTLKLLSGNLESPIVAVPVVAACVCTSVGSFSRVSFSREKKRRMRLSVQLHLYAPSIATQSSPHVLDIPCATPKSDPKLADMKVLP